MYLKRNFLFLLTDQIFVKLYQVIITAAYILPFQWNQVIDIKILTLL